jgi:hypothetical protein
VDHSIQPQEEPNSELLKINKISIGGRFEPRIYVLLVVDDYDHNMTPKYGLNWSREFNVDQINMKNS